VTRVLHLLKGDDTELLLNVLAQQQAAGDELTLIRLPGAVTITPPAGVTVLRAPEDQPHGSRHGVIVDPFGHRWMISTPL